MSPIATIPPHVHFAPMFRDAGGRAITFPHMQGSANDANLPVQLGMMYAGDPNLGLEYIGLAQFLCQDGGYAWKPDGVHPQLGYYKVLAGPIADYPNLTIGGRC